MKIQILTISCLLSFVISCFSQQSLQLTQKADSALFARNYCLAINYYEDAFSLNTNNKSWYEGYNYSEELANLASCFAHFINV
jgi:hypothetical protein